MNTWTYVRVIGATLNDRSRLWANFIWLFSLVHVPSANMEDAGFVTQQGAMEMLWLYFWGAVTSSIFICSLWLWCEAVDIILTADHSSLQSSNLSKRYLLVFPAGNTNVSIFLSNLCWVPYESKKVQTHIHFVSWLLPVTSLATFINKLFWLDFILVLEVLANFIV